MPWAPFSGGWRSPTRPIDWTGGNGTTAVAIGAPAPGASCNALAYLPSSGHLWGAFITAGDVLGLYESTTVSGAETFAGQPAITDPAVHGLQVTLIQVANGNLFVVTATVPVSGTDYVYNLESSTTGPLGPRFPRSQIWPRPSRAWDGTAPSIGPSARAPGPQRPRRSSTPVPTLLRQCSRDYGALGSYTIATTDVIHGLFASPSIVIICTKNEGVNYLYAGTWYRLTDTQNSVNVGFLCATASGDAAGDYMIGSDGYGYYFLSPGAHPLFRPTDSNDTTIAAVHFRGHDDSRGSGTAIRTEPSVHGDRWRRVVARGLRPDDRLARLQRLDPRIGRDARRR